MDTSWKTESPSHHELSGIQVLLVEDSRTQQQLYASYLTQAGASVALQSEGAPAVVQVQQDPGRFDVIVMDFELPDTNGLLATQSIRQSGYQGMVIAVTCHEDGQLAAEWLAGGASLLLCKPLHKSHLLNTVREALENLPAKSDARFAKA